MSTDTKEEASTPQLVRIVEALLFVGGAPLSAARACEVVRGLTGESFLEAIGTLNRDYRDQGRPYRIQPRDQGYELALRPNFAAVRERMMGATREARLSPVALDTLSLVAYRQPVTREEVDTLRGADSLAQLRQLVRLGLIAVQRGAADAEVRYGTTGRFLRLFGLRGLDDLPRTRDLDKMCGGTMAVYFVFRSHYDEPSGKLLRRFDDATVLEWFRRNWNMSDDAVDERLGWPVDAFLDLFGTAYDDEVPAPETDEQLEALLGEHILVEKTIVFSPHAITIRSLDDCNMEACSYFFDDVYLAAHPERVAFLLHEGWRLPGGHSEAGGFEPGEPSEALTSPCGGSGATYIVCLYYDYDNDGCLTDLTGAARFDGLRLPELVGYVATKLREPEETCLLLLRSQLFAGPLTDDPMEEGFRRVLLDISLSPAAWRRQAEAALMAYSDWLAERQDRPAGSLFLEQAMKALALVPVAHFPDGVFYSAKTGFRPAFDPIGTVRKRLARALKKESRDDDKYPRPDLCHVHVEEHLAQLCLNTEHWRSFHRAELYHQWIFFDDLWAAAHPVLANAILRYARCWDVLSPGKPFDDDFASR